MTAVVCCSPLQASLIQNSGLVIAWLTLDTDTLHCVYSCVGAPWVYYTQAGLVYLFFASFVYSAEFLLCLHWVLVSLSVD